MSLVYPIYGLHPVIQVYRSYKKYEGKNGSYRSIPVHIARLLVIILFTS